MPYGVSILPKTSTLVKILGYSILFIAGVMLLIFSLGKLS